MKKLLVLSISAIIMGLVSSCNDDVRDSEYAIKEVFSVKIDSVRIPVDTMDVMEVQQFRTYSQLKKSCEGIYNVNYYYGSGHNRSVTNIAYKLNKACDPDTYTGYGVINFQPREKGVYTFKFWAGKDNENNNVFIEKKVVVK